MDKKIDIPMHLIAERLNIKLAMFDERLRRLKRDVWIETGSLLRKQRKSASLTMMAAKASCTVQHLWDCENGNRFPNQHIIDTYEQV